MQAKRHERAAMVSESLVVIGLPSSGLHKLVRSLEVQQIENANIVNSFGQKLDNIVSGQVLQVVADIKNSDDLNQDFVYILDIKDSQDNPIRPTQWITGTLMAAQTFNVGLSWIPETSGEFTATIYTGNSMGSVSHVADIDIIIN